MRRDPFLATRPSGPGHIKRLGSASEQSPTVSGVLPSTAFRDASTSSLRDGTSVFHSCKPTHSGLQPILVCYQFTALLRFRAQRWQNTTSVGDVMYLLSSDALRDSNRVLTGRWTRCVSVYPSSRHGRFPCRWQPPAVEGTRAWTARSAIASSRKNSCTGPSTVSVTGPARDGVVSRSRSCSKPYRNSYMPTCVMPIAMRACVTPFPGPPSCIEVRIKDQASRSSSQVA